MLVADLSNYDEATNTYIIPKISSKRPKVDCCYIIRLDKSLLIADPNSVLSSNWNKGTFPKCEYYKVDVVKEVGKLIYVNGIGYDNQTKQDLDSYWSGWLPIQQVSIVEEI